MTKNLIKRHFVSIRGVWPAHQTDEKYKYEHTNCTCTILKYASFVIVSKFDGRMRLVIERYARIFLGGIILQTSQKRVKK